MMLDLDNQAQSILTCFDKEKEETKSKYQVLLNASIDVARFLLKEGMPFQGHDESETSARRGNFLDLLKWYADKNEDVKQVVLENAPQNDIMICPSIQKDIVSSCAKKTMKAIVEDLNGDYFGILLDESKDVSHKEQMALVLRYVNKEGSFKRREMLRDDQAEKLKELLVLGDTRWSSHFKTVRNFISLFSSIIHVLGVLAKEGSNYQERSLAKSLVDDIRSYEFMYTLHLMLKVLAITHDLNMVLQRKDQDIVNAMNLVGFTKRQLQSMRESKWDSLVKDVSSFCVKHDIVIPEMDKNYALGKSKRKISSVKYSHHLRVEVFNTVIDLQLAELNNRFDEVNTDLLLGMARFESR
ncbi:uncharacterized protein LOC132062415 [Lycium ferocissimum]|uniref:uncharacterized protein LOC132062415 n=1 Tax=Lycium ferocissimum TaxID=112874 RepID=UPI002815E0A6|nr:uncharacterized protein LOC132062415 [Lycium ferocissimum]